MGTAHEGIVHFSGSLAGARWWCRSVAKRGMVVGDPVRKAEVTVLCRAETV